MRETKIVLWGATTTRSFRPIWTAEELGLSYELKPIGPRTGETQTIEYTEMNRKQKIPFMQDGDLGLSESVAISRYLVEQYDDAGVIYRPDTVAGRAREDEWICYLYGELDETSLYVMRRHGDLAAIYGDAPAAVTASKAYAEKHLEVVDRHISNTPYVLGDEFGLADIMLMSILDWANVYGFTLSASLAGYRERIAERPAYQRAFAINYPRLAGGKNDSS